MNKQTRLLASLPARWLGFAIAPAFGQVWACKGESAFQVRGHKQITS